MRATHHKNTSFIGAQIEALQRNYTLMIGLILLFVCIVVWMIISIVETEDVSNLTATAKKHTAQLNPNLDQATLAKVATKQYYSETDLTAFPIFVLIEDRSGNFQVVSIDTAAEAIEAIRSGTSRQTEQPSTASDQSVGTQPTPTPTLAPTPTPSPVATPDSVPTTPPVPTPTPAAPEVPLE